MAFEIESKQQVLDVLAPELTPEEATTYLPLAQAQFAEQTREHEKAKAQTAQCKDDCDQNALTARVLASNSAALKAERDELNTAYRAELFAMHGDCDVEGVSGMLRKKEDAVNSVDAPYSLQLEVKS